MLGVVARRVVQAVPLLIGISVLVFALLQLTPGGPLASAEAATQLSAAQLEQRNAQLGLDDPVPVQYLNWAGGVVTGDWGSSYSSGRPVLEVIVERLPVTATLTISAAVVSLLVAVPLGVAAARRQYSALDHTVSTLSVVGVATPSFWLGLMLVLVFSFTLGWLPASGLYDPRVEYEGFAAVLDYVRHLIMPVAVLAAISTANLTRYVRAAVLDVLQQDYVRTARASGLPERTVIYGHVMKNASLPVATVAVLTIPELFLGTLVTETIFSLPGVGRLFIDSAQLRDYPVLLGIVLIGAFLVILANLVADVGYGLLDPRTRNA